MWIECKILTNDFLIFQKIKGFIEGTLFFRLVDINDNNEKILFLDIDSIRLDDPYIEERIKNHHVTIIISSMFSKEIINNIIQEKDFIKIGFLRKDINYSQFIEEVGNTIDSS